VTARVHVGLNLIYLVPGETGGMETHARELIPRLAELDGLRLTAFINREADAAAPGPWHEIEHEVVPVWAKSRVQWVRGEQQLLPRLARQAGVDLVHSLASTAPLHGRFARVTTIHDLNYRMVPDAHFGLLGLGMRILVPAAARRSRRIMVDAASTREDLATQLGVSPGKVDVVPLATPTIPSTPPTPESELRERLGLGDRRVVLSPSAKRPHKNLPRLLRAVAAIDARRRPLLVIPGYSTPHEGELRGLARELAIEDDLRLPAWVSTPDLEGLYALADAVVFPSLYEGFGLPVLEAMARGVPVACSRASSLPEVAGDAALLFDPEDVDAIRAATERLLGDGELRERLRAAGRERAARFTWEVTAAGTVASYERALA
jgi:glycosyltransferase involved in cell wall biosynthesis